MVWRLYRVRLGRTLDSSCRWHVARSGHAQKSCVHRFLSRAAICCSSDRPADVCPRRCLSAPVSTTATAVDKAKRSRSLLAALSDKRDMPEQLQSVVAYPLDMRTTTDLANDNS